MSKRELRLAIVHAAWHDYAHESRIRYRQERPMRGTIDPGDIYMDCSEAVTRWYRMGGASDPNGAGYDGTGWTGTLKQHGRRVRIPRLADLVFYPNPEHIALFVGRGLVMSMGSDPGPQPLPWRYRRVSEIRRYI